MNYKSLASEFETLAVGKKEVSATKKEIKEHEKNTKVLKQWLKDLVKVKKHIKK